MTPAEYKKMTRAELLGKRVVSRVPLRNGNGGLPAGTKFTITDKFKGLALRSDPCDHCLMELTISRVPPTKVLLLPEGESCPR